MQEKIFNRLACSQSPVGWLAYGQLASKQSVGWHGIWSVGCHTVALVAVAKRWVLSPPCWPICRPLGGAHKLHKIAV